MEDSILSECHSLPTFQSCSLIPALKKELKYLFYLLDSFLQQFLRSLSHYINRHKETRRRNVHYHPPNNISLQPGVVLSPVDVDVSSLSQIFDINCKLTKSSSYAVLDRARELLSSIDTNVCSILSHVFTT